MITENLSTLKINKLTQEQYDRELEAGNIDANALYLTPDVDITPIESGGTGANTEEEARENLGIGILLTDSDIEDGATNVAIADISKYKVLTGTVELDIDTDYHCTIAITLLRSGIYYFYGSGGGMREDLFINGGGFDKVATSSVVLKMSGDTVTTAEIKVKVEDETTVYSAYISKLYGIC